MDRLDLFKGFVAVAEAKSFARAARILRRSPAAMTRAIAALEQSLGAALFRRTTRSVTLTDDGTVMLDHARRILAEVDLAQAAFSGTALQPHGLLVVTASVIFGRLHIVLIVAQLLAAHPKLDVRLVLVDRTVRLVEEGIDVAVRIAELPDSALHAVKVSEVQRVLVASPSYLKSHGTPKTLNQLREHDIISFEGLSPNDEWRLGGKGSQVFRYKPRLAVNSADAAIAAAMSGLGITRVLSYQVAQDLAAGRLRTVLDDLAPPPTPVNLVYQAQRSGSVNVRAFLDEARAYFKIRTDTKAGANKTPARL
ncbi:MAG: LysR family transcriptional regulator [Rhodospirillaceae bacterium]|nr:LysR family transcriptional regulator [Rhodospirillaceae bacterium]